MGQVLLPLSKVKRKMSVADHAIKNSEARANEVDDRLESRNPLRKQQTPV